MIQATLYGPVVHALTTNLWCPLMVDLSKCIDLEQLLMAPMATGISLIIRRKAWMALYLFMLLNYQAYNRSAVDQPE